MSEPTEITVAKPVPIEDAKAPAPGPEMDAFLKKAAEGDKSCLPQVRALLSEPKRGEYLTEQAGSSAEWVRNTIAKTAGGKSVLAQEAIKKKLDTICAGLEGPNPTPIERLLAERASICWFIVNWHEDRFIDSGSMSLAQAEFANAKSTGLISDSSRPWRRWPGSASWPCRSLK